MPQDIHQTLSEHGIQPSSQRVAIARYVLNTNSHPSADDVWTHVKGELPVVSRATVYNTLNLFVAKGLIQELFLAEGKTVFDPRTDTHHHFIDEETGRIHDIDWDRIQVCDVESLEDEFEIRDYQVVIRGRMKSSRRG